MMRDATVIGVLNGRGILSWMFSVCAGLGVCFGELVHAQDIFVKAVRNNSTNTPLALIVLETPNGRETVPVSGIQLMSAIMKERGLTPERGGYAVAERIALLSRDRVFRFMNPEAIKMLKQDVSPEVTKAVRTKLAQSTRGELIARFSRKNGFADIYPAEATLRGQYDSVIALVCLEHQIPVMHRCIDGALDIAP